MATVSYVLTGARPVAPETRARIRAAMGDLGYAPNRMARGLALNRSDTVAAVLPVREAGADPLFAAFVRGAAEAAHALGFHILVASEGSLPGPEAYGDLVRGSAASGLIVTSIREADARVQALTEQGIPTVLFGRSPEHPDVPWVDVDNQAAVEEAMRHLVATGRRQIAFLGGPRGFVFAADRRRGYLAGLRQAGFTAQEPLIREGAGTEEDGYRLTAEILGAHAVDALVAASDHLAIGALRALRAAGLRAGVDVAVVGFDDSPLALAAHPPLTSIGQPLELAGRSVAETLITRLAGGHPRIATLLPATLHIRASSHAGA